MEREAKEVHVGSVKLEMPRREGGGGDLGLLGTLVVFPWRSQRDGIPWVSTSDMESLSLLFSRRHAYFAYVYFFLGTKT